MRRRFADEAQAQSAAFSAIIHYHNVIADSMSGSSGCVGLFRESLECALAHSKMKTHVPFLRQGPAEPDMAFAQRIIASITPPRQKVQWLALLPAAVGIVVSAGVWCANAMR